MNLYVSNNKGGYEVAPEDQIMQMAADAAQKRLTSPTLQFNSVAAAKKLLPPLLAGKDYEVFCVAFLNAGFKMISFEEMFRGTTDHVPVYPREVIKRALALGAEHIIMVHNHPSGSAEPSTPDIMMTLKMMSAASAFDIDVLDHFVVAGNQVTSVKKSGKLNPVTMIKTMLEQMVGTNIEVIEHHEEDDKEKGSFADFIKRKLN